MWEIGEADRKSEWERLGHREENSEIHNML